MLFLFGKNLSPDRFSWIKIVINDIWGAESESDRDKSFEHLAWSYFLAHFVFQPFNLSKVCLFINWMCTKTKTKKYAKKDGKYEWTQQETRKWTRIVLFFFLISCMFS